MLDKPNIPDEAIADCMRDAFGPRDVRVTFLPIGADPNSAVYRAVAPEGNAWLVKLRRGDFDEMAVAVPKFLSDQGIRQVVPPQATKAGRLWAELGAFKMIVYPFIQGHNGYEAELSDRNWVEFGAALRAIHSVELPRDLAQKLPRETFAPRWRLIARTFLERVRRDTFEDQISAELAEFLNDKRSETVELIDRAERLARTLRSRAAPLVLCHSDIHAGNVLIDAGVALYIIDWDNPILAPKERDLMYAGGAQFGRARTPQEEERLFYQGYGSAEIEHDTLAYYRYERIVEDIAAFCEELLSGDHTVEDRAQSLRYLKSNFLPGNTIDAAYRAAGASAGPHFA